jgi:hypothetical protein
MNIPNYENIIPQGNLNKAHFVGNVLREVFGIQSPVYVANAWFNHPAILPKGYELSDEQKAQFPNYEDVRLLPAEESRIISAFGTPVLGDITFEAGWYNIYNKLTGAIEKKECDKYTLPYSCIVDFSRENNVITTPVLGGTGTVKELYGIGDWDITIRGIAFNGDSVGNSAHEQINDHLIKWADLCDSIEVSGAVFLKKGINRIVIKSIDIQPIEAKWNVIPFTIQAISDEPIELTI